ncbi:MAG: GNAT family N-acetyltransferase [Ktedonobacterales bacterium]
MSTLPNGDIVVRPPQTDAEIDAYNRLAVDAFRGATDVEAAVRHRRQTLESMPEFDPIQQRCAFREDVLLGGYEIFERHMHIGESRVLTGCIGAVVAAPGSRMQGVATAMLNDAIAFARARGHGLLLLDGIPNFYHRFGFVDVFDRTDHAIRIDTIPQDPPDGYTVQPATARDALILLDLYERHYRTYSGSFARTVAQQEWRLRFTQDNPRLLALAPNGNAEGYLIPYRRAGKSLAVEVAADTWPAALALLQHHARLVASSPEPSDHIWWPLPPDATTTYLLADHLTLQAIPPDTDPVRARAVRGETYMLSSAGWMARLVSLRHLLQALIPELDRRWSRARVPWTGPFILTVGDESYALDLHDDSVTLLDTLPENAPSVNISQQSFTQLLFGYRPTTYIASRTPDARHHVPVALLPALEVLFPPDHTWIPGTDAF